MTYNGFSLSCVRGVWTATDRGRIVAQGSKDYVFSVLDGLT